MNGAPAASSAAARARMKRQTPKDTQPEIQVRRLLHAAGLRYRVHIAVPGRTRRTIDICFRAIGLAVFLDGCFWHGCPQHATYPAANADWWAAKLAGNQRRDADTTDHLRDLGWTVARFWTHEPPEAVAGSVREMVATLRGAGGAGSRQRIIRAGRHPV